MRLVNCSSGLRPGTDTTLENRRYYAVFLLSFNPTKHHEMNSNYVVAIFGGAVSGAEAAHQLAQQGIASVVFDQNILPYGKIEDGLPKWHAKLRDKEENAIREKLGSDMVEFVPGVKLGEDVQFEDVVNNWGFSAVFLATGAWKDRPLAIEGISEYAGKGLIYQNPFIYWYNHKHEPDFKWKDSYEIKQGAIVVGGGLASLDVVKVLMLECVESALKERGHDTNLFALDRSIAKVLDGLGLTLEDLGIEPCTLYYRRRVKDMPLSPLPTDTPEQLAKAQGVREKILNNYQSKYLFRMESNRVPTGLIAEDGKLVGLKMSKTEVADGKVSVLPGTEEDVFGPYVISSIGSIPQPIPGIPHRGSTYDVVDDECCRIRGYSNVFAVGNAVTGRGNIKESLKHGAEVSQRISSIVEDPSLEALKSRMEDAMEHIANAVDGVLPAIHELDPAARDQLLARVRDMQRAHGYDGDFAKWADKHTPVRLEQLIGGH